MKTSQYMHRFERATRDMSREEILERLEGVSPAGSGAADGCAGREAGGQPAVVEARSVESRAVAPVESAMKEEPLTGYERVKLLIDVAINRRPYHGELSAAATIIALDEMGLIDRMARRRQVSEASGRRNVRGRSAQNPRSEA